LISIFKTAKLVHRQSSFFRWLWNYFVPH